MKRLRQAVHRETLLLEKGSRCSPSLGTTQPCTTVKFATRTLADRPHKLGLQNQIRFYMSGEYGSQFDRPHFHAILFNLDFLDKQKWKVNERGDQLYRSPALEKIWTNGYSSIGAVTYESAAYVASYVMKKINGDKAKNHYQIVNPDTGEIENRKPEFNNMSRKPGIGAEWLKKWKSDVYPDGTIVIGGQEQKAPKYYDRQYEREDPEGYEDLQHRRHQAAIKQAADNTPARRLVKDQVTRARLATKKRRIT